MERRKIGLSNLSSSVIGFGCWGISGDLNRVKSSGMIAVLREAYEAGINYFDSAPIYGFESLGPKGYGTSEKLIGQALKGFRENIIIATKFGYVLDENGKAIFNSSRDSIKKE